MQWLFFDFVDKRRQAAASTPASVSINGLKARTLRSSSRRLPDRSSSSLSSRRSVGFLNGSFANVTPRDRGVPASRGSRSRALRSSSLSLPHRTPPPPDAPSPRSRLSRSLSRSESWRDLSAEFSTFWLLLAPRLSACFSKLSMPPPFEAEVLGERVDLRGVCSPTSSLSSGLCDS